MTKHEDGQLPQHRYLDRELAWLDFNNRVLDLARDAKRIPLLERVKFLAIFSNNLDEFFMVRVAGLKRRIQAGVAVTTITGARPGELHDSILKRTAELVAEQSRLFQQEIRPQLRAEGIEILTWEELTAAEKDRMRTLFGERIFPVLTPLAVDSSHPFPYISGLSVNLAVLLRNPATGARQFARVKVPTNLSRFVKLAEGRFVPLEEIISRHLGQLFAGMEVLYHATFRVTRNEDIEVEEDDAENLLGPGDAHPQRHEPSQTVRHDDRRLREQDQCLLKVLLHGLGRPGQGLVVPPRGCPVPPLIDREDVIPGGPAGYGVGPGRSRFGQAVD